MNFWRHSTPVHHSHAAESSAASFGGGWVATSAQFNPAVIQEFADRLYKQADQLVLTWALRIGFLAGLLGFVTSAAVMRGSSPSPLGALILGLIGALFGAAYGRERGFELRLRAQEALCQLRIEINTRPSATGHSTGATS